MSVLVVDTAARSQAWLLRTGDAGDVEAERSVPGGRLDIELPGALAALLDASLRAVVVLTGPGSYTGVRAGMAAALGVATARAIPLHGCGNLAAIAHAAGGEHRGAFLAVADAGRGGVHVARYDAGADGATGAPPVVLLDAADVPGDLPAFAAAPVPGVAATVLPVREILAAAAAAALASPPLRADGLAATPAVNHRRPRPR